MDYKARIARCICEQGGLDLAPEDLQTWIEQPPQRELGDYAFPCFRLAKSLRQAPPAIAQSLLEKVEQNLPQGLSRVEIKGAYLNFFLDRAQSAQELLTQILDPNFVPGRGPERGETVLVEYSSPNIAKPFHVGHAFSTVLGEALKRIYGHLGYEALGLNHLGDYGTQFGKLIAAYKRWGDPEALEREAIPELLRIYVKFHEEAEKHPELEDEARDYFRRLEQGEAEEQALWSLFREASLEEFKRVYKRLGVCFDNYNGESFYSDKIPAVVELLRDKGLLEESEGAQVVRLDDYKMPPCIILKSDGTTIYASRDLAAILYRWQTWHFARNIYVVGLPQSLHFKQVFGVLERAGQACREGCVHVGFGTVKFPKGQGTMSTRSGQVILLEDLLNESVAKTRAIIRENAANRGQELAEEDLEQLAQDIGVSAVQYAFLRNGRERDIIFTWEDMLDFNGDSAPYLQYSYARARSVLRRAGLDEVELNQADFSLLTDEESFALLEEMRGFDKALIQAAENYEPSILARHLQTMARSFSRFYSNCSILTAEEGEKRARLALLAAYCKVLKTGLELLGLRAVERM